MKKMIYIFSAIIVVITVTTVITLAQSKFGKYPSGVRLERIKKSPNYRDGLFQNQSNTPALTEGTGYVKVFLEFFFTKKIRVSPVDSIPSMKTDLKNLNRNQDILVWFGHSSYFMQIDGKRILVDPVFSGHASPFSFTIKAFKGANCYTPADMPEIDYLFITHDHWDHLDFETVQAIKPKIGKIICPLGVGETLEYWGYDSATIIEMDWYDKTSIDSGFTINATPARHFSGRWMTRNRSLWSSFVFQTPSMNIFIGGDGGYDKHFAEIGKTFAIDLAIMENGQYNKNWKYIHTMPDELIKAFTDLKAKRLFTVHNSKFPLAHHPWDEPLINISAKCSEQNIPLITPKIGEQVSLKDTTQKFSKWWEGIN